MSTKRRIVSIRTVAEKAGVSLATVSNVLTGKPSVNAAMAARVKAAAAALVYVADGRASRLRSRRHALAAVVVPNLGNPMFGGFVTTIEGLARADGFDLLVAGSADDPAEEAARLHAIQTWRPSGLIVIPTDGALASRLPRGHRTPVVAVDRIPDDASFDLVAVDNRESAAAVVTHVAEKGHRSCLVAGTSLAISNVRERWEGAASAGGETEVTLIEVGMAPVEVKARLAARLGAGPPPDVLFCLDHVTSRLAYGVLGDLGLAGPAGLALASFDETEWMRLVRPGITAVRQPVDEMAATAWAQLMSRLAGEDGPPVTRRLACTLTARGSTARRGLVTAGRAA